MCGHLSGQTCDNCRDIGQQTSFQNSCPNCRNPFCQGMCNFGMSKTFTSGALFSPFKKLEDHTDEEIAAEHKKRNKKKIELKIQELKTEIEKLEKEL